MVGLRGLEVTAEEREWLEHPLVGGVILFRRNVDSPEQVTELARMLRGHRRPAPLLAVDQEGGRVQRLTRGMTELPAVGTLGRLYERDPAQALSLAADHGWLMAAEVRAAGLDLSFAPVVDLDRGSTVIGDRAFHADPQAVSALAERYIGGMRRAGMAATAKHFPGHGSIAADSHHELPVDRRSLGDLMGADLVPFAHLIAHDLPGIMAAHVVYPDIDDLPASFSRTWLKDVLRDRLGYRGAVFSDDLCMAGAAGMGDVARRARRALEAGCDMALVCEPDVVPDLLDRLEPREDAARSARLLAMRGSGHQEMRRLRLSRDWRNAVRHMEQLEEQA
jgi:beta-N-acetylhexosaminidase